MAVARVFVTLKRGVLDPQGQATAEVLRSMGFGEVAEVRVGKLVEVELHGGERVELERAQILQMCEKLLHNPVIEDYNVEWSDKEVGH